MDATLTHAERLRIHQAAQAHAFSFVGPISNLSACRGVCACGEWELAVPVVGSYGHTTNKARIAQVKMAHGKHLRAVLAPDVWAAVNK